MIVKSNRIAAITKSANQTLTFIDYFEQESIIQKDTNLSTLTDRQFSEIACLSRI